MEYWNDGSIYNKKFTFCFGDCTPKLEASVYTVLKMLSEIAGEDYERRGLGHYYLIEYGQVFLLSRTALRFHKMPVYAQEVVLSTWEREIRGPLFVREFEIRGLDGKLLIGASSGWLVADPVSREILRPSVLERWENACKFVDRSADCPALKKLRRNQSLQGLGERPVYYSDLDGNGHVNNAVYGEIAVDFLPEELRERALRDFHITFSKETKPGEKLDISGGFTRDGYEVQGCTGDNLHFAAAFAFEEQVPG